MSIVYTLREKENSGELHLFEADGTTEGCTSHTYSICEGMHRSESVSTRFECKTDDDARTRCATIGRDVCGTCVSSLYTTY